MRWLERYLAEKSPTLENVASVFKDLAQRRLEADPFS